MRAGEQTTPRPARNHRPAGLRWTDGDLANRQSPATGYTVY
jgi:hypothetical protein